MREVNAVATRLRWCAGLPRNTRSAAAVQIVGSSTELNESVRSDAPNAVNRSLARSVLSPDHYSRLHSLNDKIVIGRRRHCLPDRLVDSQNACSLDTGSGVARRRIRAAAARPSPNPSHSQFLGRFPNFRERHLCV